MSASCQRETFIKLACETDIIAFNEFFARKNSNITVMITGLTKFQVGNVLKNILVNFVKEQYNFTTDQNPDKPCDKSTYFMNVCEVVKEFLKDDTYASTQGIMRLMEIIHEFISMLPLFIPLQQKLVEVCEIYYVNNYDDRDNLILNAFVALIQYILSNKIKVSSCSRLFALRDFLLNVQLDQAPHLLKLLIKCMTATQFLNNDKGIKFLVEVFQMNVKVVKITHATIKNNLPICSDSMVHKYKKIYTLGWYSCNNKEVEELIAEHCIQDIMYLCIYCKNGKVVDRLRTIFKHLLTMKHIARVNMMIIEKYQPILWRALEHPNMNIRISSAHIFCKMFPMLHPGQSNQTCHNLLAKQYSILRTLIQDDQFQVRVEMIKNIGSILATDWEMIDPLEVKFHMGILINKLAFDKVDASIRVAVLMTLINLLNNVFCHTLLQRTLPNLRNLLHDNSEKVRLAYLKLMYRISYINGFKLYSVVSKERLLAQLAIDNQRINFMICKLLVPEYLPINFAASDNGFQKLVEFLKLNEDAARNFYAFVTYEECLSMNVKLLRSIFRRVIIFIMKFKGNSISNEKENESPNISQLNISAPMTMEVAIQTMEIAQLILNGIKTILKLPENEEHKKCLYECLKLSIPILLMNMPLEETRLVTTIVNLSGFISKGRITSYRVEMLAKLKALPAEFPGKSVPPERYVAVLQSFVQSHIMHHIINYASDNIKEYLQLNDPEAPSDQVQFSLDICNWCIGQSYASRSLFVVDIRELTTLSISVLSLAEPLLHKRLEYLSSVDEQSRVYDDILIRCFKLNQIYAVLLKEVDETSSNGIINHLQWSWLSDVGVDSLVPQHANLLSYQPRPKRTRRTTRSTTKESNYQTEFKDFLVYKFISVNIAITRNMLTIQDNTNDANLRDICKSLISVIQSKNARFFITDCMHLLSLVFKKISDPENKNNNESLIHDLTVEIITSHADIFRNISESKLVTSTKSALAAIFEATLRFKHTPLCGDLVTCVVKQIVESLSLQLCEHIHIKNTIYSNLILSVFPKNYHLELFTELGSLITDEDAIQTLAVSSIISSLTKIANVEDFNEILNIIYVKISMLPKDDGSKFVKELQPITVYLKNLLNIE